MRTEIITHYANDMEMGIIRDHGGEDFVFKSPHWNGSGRDPRNGDKVSFEIYGLAAINVAIIDQQKRA